MIQRLSKHSLSILLGCCCWFVIAACDDENQPSEFTDGRDNKTYKVLSVRGRLWFAEDLRFEDSTSYSYQQGLNACPPGWSLPTKEDWIELNNYFGGYIYNREEIGEPTAAYNRMLKEFGAQEETFYWTSTPAWDDAPSIRSSVFYFNSYLKAVEYGAIVVNARLRCRCINEEIQENGKDLIQFKLNNQLESFDFYRIDKTQAIDQIALFLHRRLDKSELVDRVAINFKLPASFVREQDSPVVAVSAGIEHQSSSLPEWIWESHNADSPDKFELIITFYDGVTVKGKFSGIDFNNVAIEDGTFELKINK